MTIKFSPDTLADLRKIMRNDAILYRKIEKQIALFVKNPRHPCSRIHKLTGKQNKSWSLSVTKSHRIVYLLSESETMFIVGVGTHDQVYRK